MRPSDADLAAVLPAFGLGPAVTAEFIADGLMNRNWRVATAEGVFALKLLRDARAVDVERGLGVLAGLAASGIPVPTPRRTVGGGFLSATGTGSFALSEWSPGGHVPGTALEPAQVRALGVLIARLHLVLDRPGALEPAGRAPHAKVTTAEDAIAQAEGYLAGVAARQVRDSFDESVIEDLPRRIELIGAFAGSAPAVGVPPGPFGWTHGDLGWRNMLWDGGEVTAILDWDRLGPRPFAEELVRTAEVQFTRPDGTLDLGRIAAFTRSYRGVIELDGEAVADAVARLWWKRLTGFWPLQWHYELGDRGPDELWPTGERLLRWWSERPERVAEAFLGKSASPAG